MRFLDLAIERESERVGSRLGLGMKARSHRTLLVFWHKLYGKNMLDDRKGPKSCRLLALLCLCGPRAAAASVFADLVELWVPAPVAPEERPASLAEDEGYGVQQFNWRWDAWSRWSWTELG